MREFKRTIVLTGWVVLLAGVVRWLPVPPPSQDAVVMVLRGGSVATKLLAGYLLLSSVLAVAAEITARRWLSVASAWMTPRLLRWLVVAAVAAPTVPAAAPAAADSAVVEVVVSGKQPVHVAAARSPAPAQTPGAVEAVTSEVRWTVRPGDHFWSIAEQVASSGCDVVAVWRHLIEDNRDRLADPGNPDLLIPGQDLLLPRRLAGCDQLRASQAG